MNETVYGRAPGGPRGDAIGDRESVIRFVSSHLVSLSEGSSYYPGQEIKQGFKSAENQALCWSSPFQTGQGEFWSTFPNKLTPFMGPVQKDLGSSTERRRKSRVPNFPGWTHLISLPSASECQKDYSFTSTPPKPGQQGMGLRQWEKLWANPTESGSSGTTGYPRMVTFPGPRLLVSPQTEHYAPPKLWWPEMVTHPHDPWTSHTRPSEGPMAPVSLPCQPQPLALSPSWGLRRGGIQYLFDMATAFL